MNTSNQDIKSVSIIVSISGEKIKDNSVCQQIGEIMGFGCLFISVLEHDKDKNRALTLSLSLILICVMVDLCLLLY